VTGNGEAEIEVYFYEHILTRLISTGLELAVFEMLAQLRYARRTLKRVTGVKEELEDWGEMVICIERDKGLGPFRERRLEVVVWGSVLESELKSVRVGIEEPNRVL
jgi:hypothetical protein